MDINMPRIEKILHYQITWKHALGILLVLLVAILILAGLEPWYFASCKIGLTPVVKLFLLAGMDPNLPTDPSFCGTIHPLAYAIDSGNTATCEALIAAGANASDVSFHDGAIAYATKKGNVDMVEYFISRENIGDSPAILAQTMGVVLMCGATYGKTEIIDYVIAKGYPIQSFENLTMVIRAARLSGNTELVEKLLHWQEAGGDTGTVRSQ